MRDVGVHGCDDVRPIVEAARARVHSDRSPTDAPELVVLVSGASDVDPTFWEVLDAWWGGVHLRRDPYVFCVGPRPVDSTVRGPFAGRVDQLLADHLFVDLRDRSPSVAADQIERLVEVARPDESAPPGAPVRSPGVGNRVRRIVAASVLIILVIVVVAIWGSPAGNVATPPPTSGVTATSWSLDTSIPITSGFPPTVPAPTSTRPKPSTTDVPSPAPPEATKTPLHLLVAAGATGAVVTLLVTGSFLLLARRRRVHDRGDAHGASGAPKRKAEYVFLSYRTDTDWELAGRLRADLTPRVWKAPDDIPMGQNFVQAIDVALERADLFIVLLNQVALESPWVMREIQTAIQLVTEGDLINLIPILVDDCNPPPLLRGFQSIDARLGYNVLIGRLRQAIADPPTGGAAV